MRRETLRPVAALAVAAILVGGIRMATAGLTDARAVEEQNAMLATLLPGSGTFTAETYDGADANITAVYRSDKGCVVETVTRGYAGDVKLLVGVDAAGTVTGLVVRDLSETYGLGWEALTDTAFLGQFLGTRGDAAVGVGIAALTGATVTSKAIAKGVNSASAFMTGADVPSGATEWGG